MSANKFKVGDVVKCVDNDGYSNCLTVGKEYTVIQPFDYDMTIIRNNNGNEACYYSYRFELSDDSANTQQTPKFKEGDMVYLIGFDCLKPRKLQTGFNNSLAVRFKVESPQDVFETFTEDGKYFTGDATPRIVLATEENRKILNKLLGVEYEPVKLTGSDLAKKLLKDKPQTCYVSYISDERASSRGCVDLIVKFDDDDDGGVFVSKSGTGWKFAVPCDKHGTVLMDE